MGSESWKDLEETVSRSLTVFMETVSEGLRKLRKLFLEPEGMGILAM